jgi:hypothetical protein
MCAAAPFISSAGAFRYLKLGNCVLPKVVKGKTVLYAAPLMVPELGLALRLNAAPMPNRYLDPMPLATRINAILHDWIASDGKFCGLKSKGSESLSVLQKALVASISLRTTGRVKHFADFYLHQKGEADRLFLPIDESSVAKFLKYMETTTKKSKKTNHITIAPWLSKQHKESLPKNVVRDFQTYSTFLNNVPLQVMICAPQLLTTDMDRSNSVSVVTQCLENCIPGGPERGKVQFLAHQILCDLEGLFGFCFGRVTPDSIVAGHGSTMGYITTSWHVPTNNRLSFPKTLENIKAILSDETKTSRQHLMAMGYYRKGHSIYNRVNDLELSCIESEHLLCETWKLARKTFNHYRNSLVPMSLEPFLHPIKWPEDEEVHFISQDKAVHSIMQDIVDTFMNGKECVLDADANGPPMFVLPDVFEF